MVFSGRPGRVKAIKTITMPVKNVTVTDPDGKTLSYAYDLLNNRQIAETDALHRFRGEAPQDMRRRVIEHR